MAPKKQNKPQVKQMPSHVGLFHKLKNRTKKTDAAIQFMRGFKGK